MAKINGSLASVSTDFEPLPNDLYEFHIEKVDAREKDGETNAFLINNIITAASADAKLVGRKYVHYIGLKTADGEPNEMALADLKRYFECFYGKEVVAEWTDDDFDTDMLEGRDWRGQLEIRSYTPKGSNELKKSNRIVRMEKLD